MRNGVFWIPMNFGEGQMSLPYFSSLCYLCTWTLQSKCVHEKVGSTHALPSSWLQEWSEGHQHHISAGGDLQYQRCSITGLRNMGGSSVLCYSPVTQFSSFGAAYTNNVSITVTVVSCSSLLSSWRVIYKSSLLEHPFLCLYVCEYIHTDTRKVH